MMKQMHASLPKVLSVLVTVVLFAGQTSVFAEKKKPSIEEKREYQKKLFKVIDANGDGKVTEREYSVAALWDDFTKYDTNGDGKVTKEEYMKQSNEKDLWPELDVNNNGYITFDEACKNKTVIKILRDHWKTIDTKGNGYITMNDLPLLD